MKRFISCGFTPMALLVLGMCALAGCSSEKAAPASMPPPLVAVMTLESKDIPVTDTFVGQTEGSRAVEVRAQVAGILMKRTYDEGQYVSQGQLLFEIEPDTYKAALAQAQAAQAQTQSRFTQARLDLNRVLPLYAKNAVSQRDRDTAQAAYDSAQADLDASKAAVSEAQIKLSYAYVTSPVNGYTSKEYRTVGNLMTAGGGNESLLTVVNQIDPIFANFSIPSPKFMRMRTLEAQKRLKMDNVEAQIALADGSVYPVKGKVTFVDKAVNPGTSVVSARAEFVNNNLFVLPGQFVRVTISGTTLVNAMLIPQKAVVQTQKGSMLIVIDKDNKAQMREVKLSDSMGNYFLLEEGVKPGERIVVEGTNKAVPGQPVRIQPEEVPTPAAASATTADAQPEGK